MMLSKLWNFAVQQATNSLNPQRSGLASTVDYWRRVVAGQLQIDDDPQLRLENIGYPRYPCPFGSGLVPPPGKPPPARKADGTVLILQPGGGERIFQPGQPHRRRLLLPPRRFRHPHGLDGVGGYLLTEIDGTKTDYTAAGIFELPAGQRWQSHYRRLHRAQN